MAYRLRTDLSKTAVYRAVSEHNTSGIKLPPVRQCSFKKHRGTYWLRFDGGSDCCYEVVFMQWGGFVRFRFDRGDWIDIDSRYQYTSGNLICVPFEYCLANKLLREVA